MEAGSRQVAPGELEIVRQFLNTHDVEDGIDAISTPDALEGWLLRHGLASRRSSATDEHVRRATEMRESLRALLLANNGEPLEAGAVKTLNELTRDLRLFVRFDGDGGSALEPADGGLEAALGALLAIVVRSMAEGTWPRLKACRAGTCQWAFYDHSKNHSATWCSMAVCGNRAKARAYRKRRGAAGARK